MLNDLKLMLGFESTDTSVDDRLNRIISITKARLKLLLGGIDPPESMEHIILEVSIIRFNKIGSEGMTSHIVEGEHVSFSAADSDFDAFSDEIQAFLDAQKESTRGRVRFI